LENVTENNRRQASILNWFQLVSGLFGKCDADCRAYDAEVSAAPVPLSAAVCVDPAPGIKSVGLCAVLCGSGSGRIGIIVPDPHPGSADPDPFQPNVELVTDATQTSTQIINETGGP
jgi:hypothetical protein